MNALGIDYTGHVARLGQLRVTIQFCVGAIERDWQRNQEKRENALKVLSGSVDQIFNSLVPNPTENAEKTDAQKAKFVAAIREVVCLDVPARTLLINLALVMCCTELEVFITHLVDVILTTEPRLLKSVASQKSLNTVELLDLGNSEKIFQALRDKVAKEITDANAKDMFLSHLGGRFGLLTEEELLFLDNAFLQKNGFYGLGKIKEIFAKRHQIVYRGTFPVEELDYIVNSVSLFLEIERLLTQKAIAKYGCIVKSPSCMVLLDAAKEATWQEAIDIGSMIGRALQQL